MVDPATGMITREWYRFLLNLFVLTGSGQSTLTVEDLAVGPQFPIIPDDDPILLVSRAEHQPSDLTLDPASQGGSVTSVNTVLGTTGTDLSFATVNNTTAPIITLKVPTSSATNRGALSAADWTTFNSKAPATTGTSILYGNGTGGFGAVTVGTGLLFSGGTLTCTTSGGVTSVSGTAPVASSGGATPVISMAAATASVNGYLTNTDWNTFNGKGNGTVTSIDTTSPITGGAITSSGTIAIQVANTSQSGYLTSTDWNTFNGKAPATSGSAILYGNGSGGFSSVTISTGLSFSGGVLVATGGGSGTVSAVTATTPLASSGGTNPNITIAQSSSTTNGYLVNTDWIAFNAKAPATSGTSILYGNGSGGFSSVSIGTGLSFSGGTLSNTGGGGSGLGSRTTVATTTASLANHASATATVTMGKGYALYSIQVSVGAWVTLYTSSAAQSADSSRSIYVDPTPGSGVVGEIIATSGSTVKFTPAVLGFNNDGTVSTNAYLKIYNNSGSTSAVTVTLTYLVLEV